LAIVLRSCLYGTAVVLHDGFSPERIARDLPEQRVTLLSLVPTMLHRLIPVAKPQLGNPRAVLLGGGAASPQLVRRALEAGWPICTTYGMSETASQVATATPEAVRAKPGSVGKALLFTGVTILDEQGERLPPGEIGEICVSGPTVMQGYYRGLEQEQAALSQGRWRTGDMGYLDEQGDLWVVQRRVDLIVSGGENVYPSEVENLLVQHPAIKEACVVGVQEATWGQVVAAALLLEDGADVSEEEITSFCREHLAGYKIPRRVAFFESLPRTASGKVKRDQVRRQMETKRLSR
jgi:O-succinylbenzoic acid--CoA ligase